MCVSSTASDPLRSLAMLSQDAGTMAGVRPPCDHVIVNECLQVAYQQASVYGHAGAYGAYGNWPGYNAMQQWNVAAYGAYNMAHGWMGQRPGGESHFRI
jgi:hypothetical protein